MYNSYDKMNNILLYDNLFSFTIFILMHYVPYSYKVTQKGRRLSSCIG